MTIDSFYGMPGALPFHPNLPQAFPRSSARRRRTTMRMSPGIARLLRLFGVLAAAAPVGSDAGSTATAASGADTQAVVELRQYTLHTGQRDALIELFESEFIEAQEACGMRVLAQFRDLDDPDRFVWLRAFGDMTSRRAALESFYGGEVWQAHRAAANATMIDSDNVLLLRPLDAASRFNLAGRTRAGRGPSADDTAADDAGLIVATIYPLRKPASAALSARLRQHLEPHWNSAGARPLASFVTESAENTFPRLPVRRGETVLVTFVAFADETAHRRFVASVASDADAALQPYLARAPETLRLRPTRRSLLR